MCFSCLCQGYSGSQRDPLQADEDAGKRILLPVVNDEAAMRREAQRKFGVYFTDDYNYLQHLKDSNEIVESGGNIPDEKDLFERTEKIQLPSSVFASATETNVGLLNKAAPISGPRLDWDPDIVAALDEDFDHDDPENELDDDFMANANDPMKEKVEQQYCSDDDEYTDEEDMFADASEEGDRLSGGYVDNDDTKSRFTAYSMTSSVIRRTEGLTLLDDRFEQMYAEYDEIDIGGLDHEDIEGGIDPNSNMFSGALREFEKKHTKLHVSQLDNELGDKVGIICPSDSSEDEEDDMDVVEDEPEKKWDCESILSTYSNLYNHPKLILEPSLRKHGEKQIRLSNKLGIPVDGLDQCGLTRKQVERELHMCERADRASTYRPRGETTEERRARKQAIKDERRERRVEKKANQLAFGEEKQRQEKAQLNSQINQQGVKLL